MKKIIFSVKNKRFFLQINITELSKGHCLTYSILTSPKNWCLILKKPEIH